MQNLRQGVESAKQAVGGGSKLARALGLTRQAIYQWDSIPPDHVLKVEQVTGVPRSHLRPDLYPEDREIRLSSQAVAQ
jgi:DNA-binding transcriptional regulator YdaS (Cro superfamily)